MQLKNNVTCLYTFLLNFPQFSNFFLFSAFCMKNVKQVYFDQCLECAAPKCWSKYTTFAFIYLSSSITLPFPSLPFFSYLLFLGVRLMWKWPGPFLLRLYINMAQRISTSLLQASLRSNINKAG